MQLPGLDELEIQVLEHWLKPTTTRPRTRTKLVSYLVAHFGKKITQSRALELVNKLSQAGHLVIDDKGTVKHLI